jgi:hypothetical protein
MLNLMAMTVLMIYPLFTPTFLYSYASVQIDANPRRFVRGKVLVSTKLPNIQVRLDPAFRYVGKFDFVIEGIAKGERYIFVDAKRQDVNRMFIFQFEAILPESKETYNYSFRDALTLGGHKFRHGTYAYSNQEAKRNQPAKEAALTAKFLEQKGYVLDDEYMMSRFVTVPDVERKHELILFYLEKVRSTGHELKEFYSGDAETPIWKEISQGLSKRSFENFTVVK